MPRRFLFVADAYSARLRQLSATEEAHPAPPSAPPRDSLRPGQLSVNWTINAESDAQWRQFLDRSRDFQQVFMQQPPQRREQAPATRTDHSDGPAHNTLRNGEYIVSQERHIGCYGDETVIETRIRCPEYNRRVPVRHTRSIFDPCDPIHLNFESTIERVPASERIHVQRLSHRRLPDESWRYDMDNCPQPF